MKKIVLFVLVIVLLFTPAPAGAESGRELIKNSTSFDNKQVTFRGEVIGVMIRGDYAWVNILDNGYAIGVWVSAENARKVSVVGDYKHIGDTVEVAGTFHMACAEHGGDLDIHADNFTVVATGRELDRPISIPLVMLSVVLMATAIFMIYYLRRIRKEKEKIVPWPFH